MPHHRSQPDWTGLYALAASQHGTIKVEQAAAYGLRRSTMYAIAEAQRWERAAPGVFVLPGVVDTPLRRLATVLVRVGQPAAVTGWTAAWIHGLKPVPPTTASLLLPKTRRAPALPKVSARHTRRWSTDHLTTRNGLTVTTIPRMLCDLAASTSVNALRPLFIDARQQRLTTLEELSSVATDLEHAPGIGRIRLLLRQLDEAVCDSELEWLWREELLAAGMCPDRHPVRVPIAGGQLVQVDIPFTQFKVGLETDGRGTHSHRQALDNDALRHNGLIRSEWIVFRATWTHLHSGTGEILSAVRSALVARGWHPMIDYLISSSFSRTA